MYLERQGAGALHLLPSLSRSLNKASQHMAHPSTHLALSQIVCFKYVSKTKQNKNEG
jgi:hypothetical protein